MLQKYDSITATTIGTSRSGTFVKLDNGNTGWISRAFIPLNTSVLCTVSDVSPDGFAYLTLDSVAYTEVA